MSNYLFRTYDPRLYEVVLHRSRYHSHIRLQHGIDIAEIQMVIEDPDIISVDLDDGYIENYYASGVLADSPDSYLKVCVLFKQEIGSVITAFDVEIPTLDEDVLWQK